MKKRRSWFLPNDPDVLGLLDEQAETTVAGMDELVAWANGDAAAAERLRACEHRADKQKRALRKELTEAFSTPSEPEDIFELSRGLDEVINNAKNVVGEAEAMQTEPDGAMAEMARELAEGAGLLGKAVAMLARKESADATKLADRAVKEQRHVQHTYRRAMSALIDVDDLRELGSRRELYRRLARTGDELERVAERVWYSVLKER